MTEQTKCESGNGYKVVVDFGTGPTDCCTCTIAKFEALHGPFKWPVSEYVPVKEQS